MISYDDRINGHAGMWSYGGQVHHWFNEGMGGNLDATYHDPRRGGNGLWTYMAGMRFRF